LEGGEVDVVDHPGMSLFPLNLFHGSNKMTKRVLVAIRDGQLPTAPGEISSPVLAARTFRLITSAGDGANHGRT
jgi:hypothetical protein